MDFIKGIKNLRADSSFNEVQKFLLFDMKSLAVLDEEKILSNEVFYTDGKVSLTYNDLFKNANISLQYQEDFGNSLTEGIKNWLRYRIATTWGKYDNGEIYKMGLYTEEFGCDSTEIVKEVLREMIAPKVESVRYSNFYGRNNDGRFWVDEKIQLVTDTMNSFATTFNVFLRMVIPKVDSDYNETLFNKYGLSQGAIEKYGITGIIDNLPTKIRNIYRDIYYLENIDEWVAKLSDREMQVLEELKTFCITYHTIGNFTLVPNGYNSDRYLKTSDYWDLTLLDLKEMALKGDYKDVNYKWYIENYAIFLMNNYFIDSTESCPLRDNMPESLYDNHLESYYKREAGENREVQLPQNMDDLETCVIHMYLAIYVRSLRILLCLNDNLYDNKEVLAQFGVETEEDVEESDKIQLPEEIEGSKEVEELEKIKQQDASEKCKKENRKKTVPLENISIIVFIGAQIIGGSYALYLYIRYVLADGYRDKLVREPSVSYPGDAIAISMLVLFVAGIIFLCVSYINNRNGIKKKLMILAMVAFLIICITPIVYSIVIEALQKAAWFEAWFYSDYETNINRIENYKKLYGMISVICTIFPSIILAIDSYYRKFIKKCVKAVLVCFIGISLILGILENILLLVIVLLGVAFVLYKGIQRRCSTCKKMFVLKKQGNYLIKEEDIVMLVENKNRNSHGDVIGTSEQYIPGVRQTYDEVYICKRCGQEQRKRRVQEVPKV